MNKKLFMYSLMFAAIGFITQTSQAYTHTFKNSTPFNVKIKAGYASAFCRNDEFEVQPGHAVSHSVGICISTGVKAIVYEKAGVSATVTEERAVEARGTGTYTGSGTWIVTGPFVEGERYIVVRD